MSSFELTSKIKFLGSCFFLWSIPLAIIVLNILNQRDIFNNNLLLGIGLGIIINTIWKLIFTFIDEQPVSKQRKQLFIR